ncbi:MAG: TolC family protein [Chthoniobacter sp.]|uniref:TolC family protein n=1 Tax=Chthoniobacter sp. TaxID=2510640 RepID=UPI0032A2376F
MRTATLVILLTAFPIAPRILTAGGELSEQQVVHEALAANPALQASAAKWAAMKERVPQARAWEDPMTGVKLMRSGTTSFSRYSDSEWMASQALPLSGKNLSRGRVAEAEARAAYEDVRRVRLDVVARARAVYHRLGNAYAQLALNRKNQGLLVQFVEESKAKYEVGAVSQADVLAAQTDARKLEQERFRLEQDLFAQQSALNVLMNRAATAPVGQPAAIAFKPLARKSTELEPLILAHRPEIAAAERNVLAEQAKLQLAHREWIPDPQVQVAARHFRESSDVFTEYDTAVYFSVPWANPRKYSAGVREAEQNVESARRTLESAKTEALGLLRDQLSKISSLAQQYQLSRDKIVPLAAATVETLQAGYRTDISNYLEVITAERTLRDAESAASSELADYLAALAELDALVGIDDEGGDAKSTPKKSKR